MIWSYLESGVAQLKKMLPSRQDPNWPLRLAGELSHIWRFSPRLAHRQHQNTAAEFAPMIIVFYGEVIARNSNVLDKRSGDTEAIA